MEILDSKIFVFDKLVVFFKHTDYHGFIHPYNYFEWTSYVREAFFQETVPDFLEVLSRPIKMMTVKISATVLHDACFGDHIEARLTVGKIKKVSFEMVIRFYSKQQQRVVCETTHTIVFVDSGSGQFAEIPDEMMRVIVHYPENGLPNHGT